MKEKNLLDENNARGKIRKILIATSSTYPHPGGLSSHITSLHDGFEQNGIHTAILSTSSFELIHKIVARLPSRILSRFSSFVGTYWSISLTKICMTTSVLIKHLLHRYDAIYTETVISYNAVHLISELFNIPTVLTVHHYLSQEKDSEHGYEPKFAKAKDYLRNEEHKAYTTARYIVTVDTRIKDYLITDFDINENKIRVIINSVDVKNFCPREDKNQFRKMFNLPFDKTIILCPRRLVKKNGVIYGVLALSYLKSTDQVNNYLLVFAGSGPEKERIVKAIHELALVDNVLLLGSVNPSEMKYLYNASDLVIIPSINIHGVEEATSISALEAMASNIPVIASRIGGLKEIINENTGILIDEKNYEILGEKIKFVSSNNNAKVALAAREYVENNFSHVKKAQEFLSLLN